MLKSNIKDLFANYISLSHLIYINIDDLIDFIFSHIKIIIFRNI